MAARKTSAKKSTAARRPSPAAQQRQFDRQNDLRTLQNADEIRRDSGRMRGAKTEAANQKRSLDRISKR
jgi:hypothetical protein